MKITIPPFPMITDSLAEKCGVHAEEFRISYLSGDEKSFLTLKPISVATGHEIPSFNLVDERGEWDAVNFGAKIERTITVDNPKCLFGESGVAVHDAKIGIAVLLMSLSSNHRFAIPVVTFGYSEEKITASLNHDIAPNFFRDRISLRTVMYIYSAGTPDNSEGNLANIPGTVVGIVDEIAVYIDGTGSLFPVKKESDPSKPLWRVECEWSDPFSDLFTEENVCVILNQAHPNYGLLKVENGMNGSPFLTDVIASALQIIITKVIDAVGGTDNLNAADNAVPGSIVDAARYFINTFGWDASAPERLAETIRLDFDRRTGHDS